MRQERRTLFDGKTKILYEGTEPETLIVHFKDDINAKDKSKNKVIKNKGIICNRFSEDIMIKLTEIGIPNHFIRRISAREQLIHEVDIIPIEVTLNNYASGSITETLKIPEGAPLPRTIVEYRYKNEDLKYPIVSEEQITAFSWARPEELDEIMRLTLRVNDFLTGLFLGLGLKLIDFKLEFGRLYQENGEVQIVLADEISPDNCNIWDLKTKKSLEKSKNKTNKPEVYIEIANRLNLLSETLIKELNK